MRVILTLLLCGMAAIQTAFCQEAVFFYNADSTRIRADLYIRDPLLPFIIICEDDQPASRYAHFAERLMNLNYNCLTVKLTAGNSLKSARDIDAAIAYTKKSFNKPVILCGSTYSASLCVLASVKNPHVKATIALSPGEFFMPFVSLASEVKHISKPVFVSASQTEYPYLQKMLHGAPGGLLTLFKPEKGKGDHGLTAYMESNQSNNEYWFALMMFFKQFED